MSEQEFKESEKATDNSGDRQQENTENRLQQDSVGSTADGANASRQRTEQSQGLVDKGVLPGLTLNDHEAQKGPSIASKEARPGESVESIRTQSKQESGIQEAGHHAPDSKNAENSASVQRDENGRVKETNSRRPDSPVATTGNFPGAKIEYEPGTNIPSKITFDDGGRLERSGDGAWTRAGMQHHSGVKEVADVKVDQRTGTIDIQNRDGSSVSKFADGSQIVKDENGLPTEITGKPDALGNKDSAKIEYDGKQIKSVDFGGGMKLTRNSDGNFDLKNGSKENKNVAENISIDRKTGSMTIDWKDGATKSGASSTEISRNFQVTSQFPGGQERNVFPTMKDKAGDNAGDTEQKEAPAEKAKTAEEALKQSADQIAKDMLDNRLSLREVRDRIENLLAKTPDNKISELQKMVNDKLENAGSALEVRFGDPKNPRVTFLEKVDPKR